MNRKMTYTLLFTMAASLFQSSAFSKSIFKSSHLKKLQELGMLDKIRVYPSRRIVSRCTQTTLDNTEVGGGEVTRQVNKKLLKIIVSKSTKGKIIGYRSGAIYVSFDSKCNDVSCSYRFAEDDSYYENYFFTWGISRPNYECVNGRTSKLTFKKSEFYHIVKETERAGGYDLARLGE